MRRPDRLEIYREICKMIGLKPDGADGYFSREEMLELFAYISKKESESKNAADQKR